MVLPAPLGQLAVLALLVRQDQLVQLVQLEHKAPPVRLVLLERQEFREHQDPLEQLVPLVVLVHPALPVLLGQQELLVQMVRQEVREQQVE